MFNRKAHYIANKERILEVCRRYYKNNKEKKLQIQHQRRIESYNKVRAVEQQYDDSPKGIRRRIRYCATQRGNR